MRVGLDLFPLVPRTGRGGGFHTYARELVSELVHWGQDVVLHVYANPLNADWVPSSKGVCRHIVPLPPQRELWPFRLFWQHVLFPVRAALDRLDLVHFLFDTSWIWGPVPSVVTIHDTISDVYYPTRFPGAVPDLKARYLFRAKRHAARTSRAVIPHPQSRHCCGQDGARRLRSNCGFIEPPQEHRDAHPCHAALGRAVWHP